MWDVYKYMTSYQSDKSETQPYKDWVDPTILSMEGCYLIPANFFKRFISSFILSTFGAKSCHLVASSV